MSFNLQRLRFERLSRKVSQDTVASALRINRSSYHKKENGKLKISVEEFATIVDVLGIPQYEIPLFFVQNVPERERKKARDETCATSETA
jgi:transcriptional regulator with XRE-family HTH domain